MRLRATAATALGVLALALALPSPASAAEGRFSYGYTAQDGSPQLAGLQDPPSRQCVTLPGAAEEDGTPPAHSPVNDTGATATVFTGAHCDGEHFTLRPGGRASQRLKLRSAVFS